MKETRLLLIGPLRVVGAEDALHEGSAFGSIPGNRLDCILVADQSHRGSWWQAHGSYLEQLAATVPCLYLSETRPTGLPFRCAWFSTPPEIPGVLRRAMAGLDQLDFVLLQGEDAWKHLPVELAGAQTIFIGGQGAPCDGSGSTRVVVEWNDLSEELHPAQLLRLVPGQVPLVAPVDITQLLSSSNGEEIREDESQAQESRNSIPAPMVRGVALVDQVLANAGQQLSPLAFGVLQEALSGPLPALRVPGLGP